MCEIIVGLISGNFDDENINRNITHCYAFLSGFSGRIEAVFGLVVVCEVGGNNMEI